MQITDEKLREYITSEIIPLYLNFDKAHSVSHAQDVIKNSLELAKNYDVNADMVFAVAAFHDTGLRFGRENHEITSAQVLRDDSFINSFFSAHQIEIMARAIEDHRASSGREPRSIYGRIVSEADRIIDPETVIGRTVQYGLAHYPELDRDGQYLRMCDHLDNKYSEHGYVKLWLDTGKNAENLKKLRGIMNDKDALKELFDKYYECERSAK